MYRLLVVLVVACVLITASCGDVFVHGAFNSGTQSAAGTVTIVQFSGGSGSGVSVTIVTLTGNSMANTLSFCGDQRTLFAVNKQVQIHFTQGRTCATVLSVNLV